MTLLTFILIYLIVGFLTARFTEWFDQEKHPLWFVTVAVVIWPLIWCMAVGLIIERIKETQETRRKEKH